MKRSIREWIEKAEGDWLTAQRAYRARKDPVYDAACFHCQQCVEKYLKAELNEVGMMIDKTPDLADLLKQVAVFEPSQLRLQPQADFLTDFAIQSRYPGWRAPQRLRHSKQSKIAVKCGASSAPRSACPSEVAWSGRIPTVEQTPEVLSFFSEHETKDGPYGGKGVGELASIPTTPALINVLYQATGVRCYSLPADKKWLKAALETK